MNRRIRHASLRLDSIRRTMMAVADATDPHGRRLFLFRLNLMTKAQARFNWHNDQRSARLARRNQRLNPSHDGWEHGVPASHAVSLPSDPLHTQWLSGTLTPWEYQHLVRRSQANATYEARWEQMEANLADNADDTGGVYPDHDWWLRVASEIEDDFLYRFSAPCGAD